MRNLMDDERHKMREMVARVASSFPTFCHDKNDMLSETGRKEVQNCFECILRANHAVGAEMVLVFPGSKTEIFYSGKARLHPPIPVDERTCFRIASVTKLVSTFGIMSLVEDGCIDLDQDIGELLGFPVRHPRYPRKPITLRMLLTHTAGIRNAELIPKQSVKLAERVLDLEIWLDTAPGEQFLYTNLGAGLAGAVVESVVKCPFESIMQERVFEPFGINAVYGAENVSKDCLIANGYSVKWPLPPILRYDAVFHRNRHLQEIPGQTVSKTVGRLITDADGMATFIRLLASRSDTKILSANSLNEMRRIQDGVGGIVHAGRGLNVAFLNNVISDRQLVGHQGVAYGMCSELFVDPIADCGVGIMMNGVQLNRMTLQRAGLQLLTLGFEAIGKRGR